MRFAKTPTPKHSASSRRGLRAVAMLLLIAFLLALPLSVQALSTPDEAQTEPAEREEQTITRKKNAPLAATGAEEYSVYSGTPDTGWYNSSDTVFEINTADAFAGISVVQAENSTSDVFFGKTININCNIDFDHQSWKPLGSGNYNDFSGTINGNNHIIKNLESTNGFIQYAYGATIKDLSFADTKLSIAGREMAAFFSMYTSGSCTYSNCHIKTSSAFGNYGAGGIVAYNTGTLSVTDCSVESTSLSTASGYAYGLGGIVGFNYGTLRLVDNCYVKDIQLTTSNNSSVAAGGIVGNNRKTITKITNCTVEGGTLLSKGNAGYMGGILGQNYSNSTVSEISDCTVSGTTFTQNTTNDYVGGIVAYNQATISTIKNCIVTEAGLGGRYVGGAVGYNNGTVTTLADFSFSDSSILASYSGSSSVYTYGGGVIAYNNRTCNIVNSKVSNTDVVAAGTTSSSWYSPTTYAGGMVGYCAANSNLKVTDCTYENAGISATNAAGGIVGYNTGSKISITGGTVTNAEITSTASSNMNASAGILGIHYHARTNITAEVSDCTVEDCTIKAEMNSGGVLAYNNQTISGIKDCTVKNCDISSSATTFMPVSAGILGVHKGKNGTEITNCTISDNTKIHARDYVAGILAYNTTSNLKVAHCDVDTVDISCDDTAGGIVGYDEGASGNLVNSCHLLGESSIVGGKYAGGVIGNIYCSSTGKTTIANCTAYGEVKSTGQVAYLSAAGGILGLNGKTTNHNLRSYSDVQTKGVVEIKSCVSYCDVSVRGKNSSSDEEIYAGGIVGALYSTGADLVDYCDFYGTVTGENSMARVGGIAGSAENTIVNCANFGAVTVKDHGYAAGITASDNSQNNTYVFNSYNYGDIVAESSGVASALVGQHGNDVANPENKKWWIDNTYTSSPVISDNAHGNETERIIGYEDGGAETYTYWLRTAANEPYYLSGGQRSTYQGNNVIENNGSFRSAEDTVASANVSVGGSRLPTTDGASTNKKLLTLLNEKANTKDSYMHWVRHMDYEYQYPMLGNLVTVKPADGQEEMGAPSAASDAVGTLNSANTFVYDGYNAAYQTVYVKPEPQKGYKVVSIVAAYNDGYDDITIDLTEIDKDNYSFIMPRYPVTVTVTYDLAEKDIILAVEPAAAGYFSAAKAAFFDGESFVISIDGDAEDENTKDIHVTVALSQGEYLKNNEVLTDSEKLPYLDYDWSEKSEPTVCGKVVSGLPMGKYTVSLADAWSWRYHTRTITIPVKPEGSDTLATDVKENVSSVEITLTGDVDKPYVLFSQDIAPVKWLSGEGMYNSVYSAVSGS